MLYYIIMIYQVVEILIWCFIRLLPKNDWFRWENTLKSWLTFVTVLYHIAYSKTSVSWANIW